MIGSGILGLGTGALLGLLGGGGSIIAVPILVYLLGMELKAAIATSLAIVGISSFLAAITHYHHDHVRFRTALMFGAAGCAGSVVGAEIGKSISDSMQLSLFAAVVFVVAILMLVPRHSSQAAPPHIESQRKLPFVLAAGATAGVLTGLLGVGGGFIIVPALALVLHLPIKQAIGTSLVVIGLNSTIGVLMYAPYIRLSGPVVPFAAATIAAAPIAGHFVRYVHQDRLKMAFAVGLLVLATWMSAKQICNF